MDPDAQLAVQLTVTEKGLLGYSEAELLCAFCDRCADHGLHLAEAIVHVDTLHPSLESISFFWDSKSRQARSEQFSRSSSMDNDHKWRTSPFYRMLHNGDDEYYVRLDQAGLDDFPILSELRDQGHVGYFAMIHPLSGIDTIGEMDNLYSRWSTERPGGFSDGDLRALRELVPTLALAIKAAAIRRVTQSLVTVYLGRDPGKRVLEGSIERGTVESINTVLWFSDMANYTALSEQLASADLIDMLDDYAEASISSVLEKGGDVLKLVGDGVLAIFNFPSLLEAAEAAYAAAKLLKARVQRLNDVRLSEGTSTTVVYVSLHVGEAFYGNIGSDQRLDFTVVGPAVNEVCRIAGVRGGHGSLLVSSEYLAALPGELQEQFTDFGRHNLKGVRDPKRLFALRSAQ